MAQSNKRARSPVYGVLPDLAVAGPAQKKLRGEAEPEKRLAIFKKSCPKSIQERLERVMTQRFFCIERTRTGLASEMFKVLGSTGNVYNINIDIKPSCDCPDSSDCCKHILFVFLKVLQIPLTSNLYYQKALLSTELESIYLHAKRSPLDEATKRISNLYKQTMGQKVDTKVLANRRLPVEGDSCPVCYEDFTPNQTKGLIFCEGITGCGNGLHQECFNQWAKKCNPVTCVFCRAGWTISRSASNGNAVVGSSSSSYSEGYLNLASSAGLNTTRDTSSYYNGPRRGEPYKGGYPGYSRY